MQAMVWNPWINRTWNPWQELSRFQAEMDRVLRGAPTEGSEHPAINLWSGENGLRMHARLPGLDAGDIELSVVGDTITLKGGREDEGPEQATFHRRERPTGRFVRTFQLPFAIEAEDVEARFVDGILDVSLPRAKSERPRKIAVKSA
jgi:HSP20 family protein